MRSAQERYRQREISKYLAAHGEPPECECGCSEPVRFNGNGKPRRYVLHHQPKHGLLDGRRRKNKDLIPLNVFRNAMWDLKHRTGKTWVQIAEDGGLSLTHLHSLLYSKTKKNVGKRWTTDFMRRLAGLPAPASTHQKRMLREGNVAMRETESWYMTETFEGNRGQEVGAK